MKRIRSGRATVAEPGLEEIISRAVAKGALMATTDCGEAVMNSDLSMVCVDCQDSRDDPPVQDRIRAVCSRIGVALGKKQSYHSVILRSTGAPGTAHSVAIPTLEDCSKMTAGPDFGFGSNPEFLRAGTAVHDYFNPQKIVIGALDEKTALAVSSLYKDIDAPEVITQIKIAEVVKYADNAWHILKAGFANEVGTIMKVHGVDSRKVMDILYLDVGPEASPALQKRLTAALKI